MYIRLRPRLLFSRHSSHTFRFTHTATGTFPEHKYYCAVCEQDGQSCSFSENEIRYFELVDDGTNNQEGHVSWLQGIAAEIERHASPADNCKAA